MRKSRLALGTTKPSIVLVHGAFADASNWHRVSTVFQTSIDSPAWKTIPSWYLVSRQDRAIDPDLERFLVKRAGAKTTEIDASHVPFLTHPGAVAKLIEQAARSVERSAQ